MSVYSFNCDDEIHEKAKKILGSRKMSAFLTAKLVEMVMEHENGKNKFKLCPYCQGKAVLKKGI